MREYVSAFIIGTCFALGLGISQMTMPPKIIGFLNVTGAWDPTLLVVFITATATYMLFYQFVLNEAITCSVEAGFANKPLIEWRLIAGPIVFGIGWGMMGLCPGPAMTDIMSGQAQIYPFVAAMLVGIFVAKKIF
ncbi:MAG: YeeE/YedE family protein [Chlamydiales bacterium]|nr:YeeE/YedE family protein [Chlamydiales bacterium]